jgi:hypothetical protein
MIRNKFQNAFAAGVVDWFLRSVHFFNLISPNCYLSQSVTFLIDDLKIKIFPVIEVFDNNRLY